MVVDDSPAAAGTRAARKRSEPLWLNIVKGPAMIAGIGGFLLLMRKSLASPVLAALVLLCILICLSNIAAC